MPLLNQIKTPARSVRWIGDFLQGKVGSMPKQSRTLFGLIWLLEHLLYQYKDDQKISDILNRIVGQLRHIDEIENNRQLAQVPIKKGSETQ